MGGTRPAPLRVSLSDPPDEPCDKETESPNAALHRVHKQYAPDSGKTGNRKAMFWIKEKKLDMEQRIMIPKDRAHEKIWQNSCSYVGDWKNNLREGFGVQVWPNGNKYEGDWLAGKRDGRGTLYVQNVEAGKLEKVYSGEWKADFKEGVGVFLYPNGSKYEGQWKHGMRHGNGSQFHTSGDVYIGGWIQGKMCGWGRLIKADSNEYVGEWLNGMKEGRGHFFYKKRNLVYDGEWVKDVPQCGVFGPIDLGQGQGIPMADLHLPKLEVENPDQVIQTRLLAIQAIRASVRTLPLIMIEDLFNPSELSDLERLFQALSISSLGQHVDAISLSDLLMDVGLNPTEEDIAHILVHFDKNANDRFTFAEFVKSIYLMKQLEKNNMHETSGIDLEDDE